jgi:hypothetical protein
VTLQDAGVPNKKLSSYQSKREFCKTAEPSGERELAPYR